MAASVVVVVVVVVVARHALPAAAPAGSSTEKFAFERGKHEKLTAEQSLRMRTVCSTLCASESIFKLQADTQILFARTESAEFSLSLSVTMSSEPAEIKKRLDRSCRFPESHSLAGRSFQTMFLTRFLPN